MGQMTPKQAERQSHRDRSNGRYAEVNPCYLCQRSVGVDYYSTQYTDSDMPDGTSFGDAGLVLHGDCSAIVDGMTIEQAFKFLTETDLDARRKVLTAYRRLKAKARKSFPCLRCGYFEPECIERSSRHPEDRHEFTAPREAK